MATIYGLRHEERPEDPGYFTHLTATGARNSLQLGKSLPAFTHVYTSPFVRCLETIEPFCLRRGVMARREFALYERTEDPRFTPANYLVDVVPQDQTDIVDPNYESFLAPVGVRRNETAAQVRERAQGLLAHLREAHGPGDKVLLVSHMSVINGLLGRPDASPLEMGQLVRIV